MSRRAAKSASPSGSRLRRFLNHPVGRGLVGLTAFCVFTVLFIFLYFYNHYANIVEEKLAKGPYSNTSKLFGAPAVVSLGDETAADDIVAALHRAGYNESRTNRMGWYHLRPDGVEVYPGADSYFQQEAHLIRFDSNKVDQIISLRDNTERTQMMLEPELITNLFDRNREKRRIVRFQDIPLVLRNALLSAEDKRFFQHAGFDPFRVLKSAYVDIREGRNRQGASTLSMQLARLLLLSNERSWRRKAPEILITLHMERKLTKEEIFEHYSNQIYLGRVGSFNIHGFGEGAQVFFGKDVRKLTLAEAATLAGIINSPSGNDPFRYPDRARKRRNVVLQLMLENDSITKKDYEEASNLPLGITAGNSQSEDAPYFVDLVNDTLQKQFEDHDFQANSYRVYTTLDVNLQKAAAEAMKTGLAEVDDRLLKMGRTPAKGWPQVQAALVALDPRTGEVKALIGGRDYGRSQLNRTLAKRPPGSVFKPFVYAAALSTALGGGGSVITPVTSVVDEPTTFWFDNKPYEPNNFKGEFHGPVTLRTALTRSLNVPTVKFAEMAGYEQVVELARKAGLNMQIAATPAVALGAYEVQPIEMAGAYTMFSNNGVWNQQHFIKMIRDQDGKAIFQHKPVTREALDPRIAYMMINLMEEVLRTGTGAGARSRGFRQPAAGKTGTSHDGWFAGFTTELLCVVWVGYDDNRELGLEGARSALPIWTDFMKRAHKFRPYRRATAFSAPDGIVAVEVDPASGKLASGAGCSGSPRPEVFLAGTQPLDYCSGGATQVASWDVLSKESDPAPSDDQPRRVARRNSIPVTPAPSQQAPPPQPKKGFFSRILDVFR